MAGVIFVLDEPHGVANTAIADQEELTAVLNVFPDHTANLGGQATVVGVTVAAEGWHAVRRRHLCAFLRSIKTELNTT